MSQSDREQYGGCGDAQSRQDQLLPRLQNALHQSYGYTFSRPCAAPTREQVATLLDEGVYHCSLRTMYRLLEQDGETRERRDQLTHPPYQKPELLATAPNQLWSYGQAGAVIERRQVVLDAAYQAHPERFVRSAPKSLGVPKEVWINKPSENKTQ